MNPAELVVAFAGPQGGRYPLSCDGVWVGHFHPPVTAREVARLRAQADSDRRDEVEKAGKELEGLGERLWTAFLGANPQLLARLRALAGGAGLVLQFDGATEGLLAFPWEYLREPQGGTYLAAERPLARRLGEGVHWQPLDGRPLRALIAIAEPLGLAPLEAREIHDQILEGARGLVEEGRLQLDFLLPPASPDSMVQAVGAGSYDLVHLVGHGQVGSLALEDDDGGKRDVTAEQLYYLLKDKPPRLAILTACLSGVEGSSGPFSGLVTALLRCNIPAVLAMQFFAQAGPAFRFVRDLYSGLLARPLGQGVKEARAARYFAEAAPAAFQWGVPVFYCQHCGGDLFQGVARGQVSLRPWPPPSPGDLPEKPDLFVGRGELMVAANRHLREDRVTVLRGEGGMGKTATALALAHRHRERGSYPGGILWVDLQQVAGYEGLLEAVGVTLLGMGFMSLPQKEQALAQRLAASPSLLVLDNFETVAKEEAIHRFLKGIPNPSRALLTSREWVALGVEVPVEELKEEEAAAFFRLRALKAGWDGAGAGQVGRLCLLLGYMPLAIELVAPRAASRPLGDLMDEVEKSLAAVADERPDLEPRHRSLEAAFQVSYRDLHPEQKALFARFSVFPGGGLADHIARVCQEPRAGRLLEGLHRQGLVRFGGGRYWMHPLVRRFAQGRLEEEFGGLKAYQERMALLFLVLALEGQEILDTKEGAAAAAMAREEAANLLEALGWLSEERRWEEVMALGSALSFLFERAGVWAARFPALRLALRAAQEKGHRQAQAAVMQNLGIAFQHVGKWKEAEGLCQQSLKIARELGDKAGMASSISQLGTVYMLRGDYQKAEGMHRWSLRMRRALGLKKEAAIDLHNLGIIRLRRGDLEGAEALYGQSLEIEQEIGDRPGMASTLHQLGRIRQERGDLEGAEGFYRQALGIAQEVGDRPGMAISLHQLGTIRQQRGDLEGAEGFYQQALKIEQEVGNRPGMAITLHQLGRIRQERGDLEGAEKLYRQSLGIKQEIGDRPGMAISLGQLGRLYEQRGEGQKALEHYRAAAALFHEMGSLEEEKALAGAARVEKRLKEEGGRPSRRKGAP